VTIDTVHIQEIITLIAGGGTLGTAVVLFVRTVVRREIRPIGIAVLGLRLGQSALARGIGHLCTETGGNCTTCAELEDIESQVSAALKRGGTTL
jgi:hypothetical protein